SCDSLDKPHWHLKASKIYVLATGKYLKGVLNENTH
ncbi:unnamed protein product, partial [marine sediment metagenome]